MSEVSFNCFGAAGLDDLQEIHAKQKEKNPNLSDKEIARKILQDEHKKLFDDLNSIRKSAKLPTEKYTVTDNTPKVKEINDAYNAKIEAAKKEQTPTVSESEKVSETKQEPEPTKQQSILGSGDEKAETSYAEDKLKEVGGAKAKVYNKDDELMAFGANGINVFEYHRQLEEANKTNDVKAHLTASAGFGGNEDILPRAKKLYDKIIDGSSTEKENAEYDKLRGKIFDDALERQGKTQSEIEAENPLTNEPLKEKEPTQKENADNNSNGVPPNETPIAVDTHSEYPPTSLSHAGTDRLTTEFGGGGYFEKPDVKHDVETIKNADDLIEKGINIRQVLNNVEEGKHTLSDEEYVVAVKYADALSNKLRETDINNPEWDRLLKEQRNIIDNARSSGTETARALGIRGRYRAKGENPDTYEGFMLHELDANNGADLTPIQKKEALEKFNQFQKDKADADAKIKVLEDKVAALEAEKEAAKHKKENKPKEKKTHEDYVKDRESLIEKLKKQKADQENYLKVQGIQKQGFGITLTTDMVKTIKDIAFSHVEETAQRLADVIDKVHEQLKEIFPDIEKRDIHDVIAGNYNEKKPTKKEAAIRKENLRVEAQLLDKYEKLLNGEVPKNEKKLRKRNQEIEDLRKKIKGLREEDKEANKFYGESDVAEQKLNKLKDELDRIQQRRQKEKPEKNSSVDKEISDREQKVRKQIKDAQDEWNAEKEKAAQVKKDYSKLETERNRQLQKVSDLKEKLANLQKGIKTVGDKKEIKPDTPEIEALKKEVADAEKELNESNSTKNRIKDKEDELQRLKDRKPKANTPKERAEISDREKKLNEEIAEERKKIKAEEKEANTFYKEPIAEELRKLRAIKKRNETATKRNQEIIDKGEFAPEEKKIPLLQNKEVRDKFPDAYKAAVKSRDALIKTKHEIEIGRLKQMYANKSPTEKTAAQLTRVINVPRTIMSSMDFSAPLRQAAVATAAHPILAAKAAKFMLKAAGNEKIYNRWLDDVHNSPRWEGASKSKLAITDPAALHLKDAEEAYIGANLAEQIPVAGQFIKGSERAYIGYLNKMRWDLYNQYADAFEKQGKTYDNNPELYKGIASFVNAMTGRGGMSFMESASPLLNGALFSPRLIASRMNMLGISDIPNLVVRAITFGQRGLDYGFYTKLPPAIRKAAAIDMAKFVGVGVATLGLVLAYKKATGDDSIEVESDPRSSDFGKIKSGKTRWDIWGGFQPYARLISQIISGQSKSAQSGKVYDLNGEKFGGRTVLDQVGSLVRGKLAPVWGEVADFISHRTLDQKTLDRSFDIPFYEADNPKAGHITLTDELLKNITPLLFNDVRDAMKDKGVSALFSVGIPSALGVGVQTYEPKAPKQTQSTGRPQRQQREHR